MRFYIFIFAFLFSLATIMIQRGVFFYTKYELLLSDFQNLLLALATGVTYIAGAQLSHRYWEAVGPRRAMVSLIIIQLILPLTAFVFPTAPVITAMVILYSIFNGMTWPIAESYSSAGLDEKGSSRAIGIYNLCWSTAVPLAVLLAGAAISAFKNGIFMIAGVIVVVSMGLVFFLPKVIPHHMASSADGTDDGKAISVEDMRGMLLSSRWSMGFSYALMQILASLIPGKFADMGISVAKATLLASFIDFARTFSFLIMSATVWWHGRKVFLACASTVLALGFAMAMFPDRIALIITGEIIYGIAAGFAYYSALYYAMVLSKASVGAGGSHESVIGAGFTIGPILVLTGKQCAVIFGFSVSTGMLFGFGPMALLAIPLSVFYLIPKRIETPAGRL
ncbi:MAG TPA: hypothetical protein DCZ94_00640 [Lentisphaeria bacterium]|nr:MAG: hypothetical protein A2X48_12205 [Lentisphaerae bacterium GWF2_49_21]HBC85438.1 hypothetical protein [Lentisphaeria bacterium]